MRSSLLRTAFQGLLGSNPAVGIGAAVVGVTGLTVGGVIGVTSVTRSACAGPARAQVETTVVGIGSGRTATAPDPQCEASGTDVSTTTDEPSDLPSTQVDAPDAADAAPSTDASSATEPTGLAGDPGAASAGSPNGADEARATDHSDLGGPPSVAGPAVAADATTTSVPQPFRISGSVSGLTPGNAKRLRLRIDNPNGDAIRILDIRVAVGDLPGCPGSNLQVDGYRSSAPGAPRVVVPARSSATVDVKAVLRAAGAAQDRCRDRVFPLSFSGSAEQWTGR